VDILSENKQTLLQQAEEFIKQCYSELEKSADELTFRLQEVKEDIQLYGTYEHTYKELEHGAKMAWRNSNRCIGRLFWNALHVIDRRQLATKKQ
jgi:nitric-oxide synthase